MGGKGSIAHRLPWPDRHVVQTINVRSEVLDEVLVLFQGEEPPLQESETCS